MAVKFYNAYECFSHISEITEGYFDVDLEDHLTLCGKELPKSTDYEI